MMSSIRIHIEPSFDCARVGPVVWSQALRRGASDVVFLTWEWQRAWWDTFGRGNLLVAVAERDGSPVAVAPLFADAGMVFFVGSGGSDYLDFVGDVAEPQVLDGLLDAARCAVRDFIGFKLYHIPSASRSRRLLEASARRLNLRFVYEGELPAPRLDMADAAAATAAANKKSLRRHEAFFRREGGLDVCHSTSPSDILPRLDDFFRQHIERWSRTPFPSLFLDSQQREFYRRIAGFGAQTGWVRFTSVMWNGEPIAYHFGMHYEGRYLWYKPAFAIDLARHSPGEVLLRQLLLAAAEERAKIFDFGLGEEPFKSRFASGVDTVETWGLYRPETEREELT